MLLGRSINNFAKQRFAIRRENKQHLMLISMTARSAAARQSSNSAGRADYSSRGGLGPQGAIAPVMISQRIAL